MLVSWMLVMVIVMLGVLWLWLVVLMVVMSIERMAEAVCRRRRLVVRQWKRGCRVGVEGEVMVDVGPQHATGSNSTNGMARELVRYRLCGLH